MSDIQTFDGYAMGIPDCAKLGRWVAYCPDHATTSHYRTKREVWRAQAAPKEWCEGCAKGIRLDYSVLDGEPLD